MSDEDPRKCDILFGKGADCWNHVGNKHFRRIIAKYQGKYHSMQCRSEKVELVAHIVQEISSTGARFLRRNVESKAWEEVERKTIIEKVGHAIRDKQQAKHRKRGSTENSSISNINDVMDVDNFIQNRETRMFNNDNLRSTFSQGLNHRVNLQIEDSIRSNPVLWNRCEQHLTIPYGGHAAYDGSLISGFRIGRNIASNQSYSQPSDTHITGESALSIPILRYHWYDYLRDAVSCRRLVERMTNTMQRPSRQESRVLTNLRQKQSNVDALHLSTLGLNILQENIFSDLRFFCQPLEGSPTDQAERFIHSLR